MPLHFLHRGPTSAHDEDRMVKKLADAAKTAAAKHAEKKVAKDALKTAVKGAVKDAVKQTVRGSAATSIERPGLRERKKSRTYQAIVEAAVELFEQKGFEETTIEEIAEAADISPRTFFRYFDSKLDVVMPDGEKHFEEGDETPFGDLLAARPPGESPIEAVRQVFRQELETMLEENPIATRQLRLTMTTPSLRTRVFDHFQEHQSEMARVFAARLGMSEDALQPHLLAAGVGTTIWTVVDRWVAEGAPEDRLIPLFEEGFALMATGFNALPSPSSPSSPSPSSPPSPS
jgi:AcrR family transcriptional regulator